MLSCLVYMLNVFLGFKAIFKHWEIHTTMLHNRKAQFWDPCCYWFMWMVYEIVWNFLIHLPPESRTCLTCIAGLKHVFRPCVQNTVIFAVDTIQSIESISVLSFSNYLKVSILSYQIVMNESNAVIIF